MSIRISYSEPSNGLLPAAIIDPENSSELDKQEDLEISHISNEDCQKLKPSTNFDALIEAGHFKEALIDAEALDKVWEKDDVLFNICKALTESSRFEEAIQVAKAISNKYKKCPAFHNICKALAKAGRFDEALQVARDYIFLEYHQSCAIADICEAKARVGQVDGALETAKTILDKKGQWSAFSKISIVLAEIGDAEGSIKVACMILDETEMSSTLEDASRKLVDIGQPAKAFQVANTIPPGYCKRRVLLHVLEALELAGDDTTAEEVRRIISSLPNHRMETKKLMLGTPVFYDTASQPKHGANTRYWDFGMDHN